MRLGITELAGCCPWPAWGWSLLLLPISLLCSLPKDWRDRLGGGGLVLALGMKGCWVLASSGWSTLFSETTFAASVMVEGSLGLSTPTQDAAGQFFGLAGGWDAGELHLSYSPPG